MFNKLDSFDGTFEKIFYKILIIKNTRKFYLILNKLLLTQITNININFLFFKLKLWRKKN